MFSGQPSHSRFGIIPPSNHPIFTTDTPGQKQWHILPEKQILSPEIQLMIHDHIRKTINVFCPLDYISLHDAPGVYNWVIHPDPKYNFFLSRDTTAWTDDDLKIFGAALGNHIRVKKHISANPTPTSPSAFAIEMVELWGLFTGKRVNVDLQDLKGLCEREGLEQAQSSNNRNASRHEQLPKIERSPYQLYGSASAPSIITASYSQPPAQSHMPPSTYTLMTTSPLPTRHHEPNPLTTRALQIHNGALPNQQAQPPPVRVPGLLALVKRDNWQLLAKKSDLARELAALSKENKEMKHQLKRCTALADIDIQALRDENQRLKRNLGVLQERD